MTVGWAPRYVSGTRRYRLPAAQLLPVTAEEAAAAEAATAEEEAAEAAAKEAADLNELLCEGAYAHGWRVVKVPCSDPSIALPQPRPHPSTAPFPQPIS